MLELTMGGRCIGGLDAITFFESLPESLPEKLKTEEFCNEYEYALNRLRYEVSKSVPIAPRVDKGRFKSYGCGKCGSGVDRSTNKYCPKCGRAIAWAELEPEEIESIKSLCLGGEHYVLGFLPPPNDPLTLDELREMDGEPVLDADGQCYIVNVKAGYAVDKDRGFRMLWGDGFFYRRKPEDGEL